MSASRSTQLDYLRHGEPSGGSRFRGSGVDDPLSERGWQQMRDTTAGMTGWQRVISSPMRRCREFADWLATGRGIPLEVLPDLREVGFGAWEGLRRDRLRTEHSAEYDAFYRDPVRNRPAGAEPLDAFGSRVAATFEQLLDAYAGEHLLVVCHAGVIRATLGHVARLPAIHWYRTEVHYAAITRITHDRRGARLVAHNWRPSL